MTREEARLLCDAALDAIAASQERLVDNERLIVVQITTIHIDRRGKPHAITVTKERV